MLQAQLDQAIKAVCPIHGISFGNIADKVTWKIRYKDEATDQQKLAAINVMDNFVYDDADFNFREKVRFYQDNPLYKREFKTYKLSNPSATFKDFIQACEA